MAEKVGWWKTKGWSFQRRTAVARGTGWSRAGDSFTEPVYFELLRETLKLSTVTVKVMPGKASDPRRVIQSAADEVKTLGRRVKRGRVGATELEKFDHVWAVIDTDVAIREGFWGEVVQKARELKVKLAHSTPCFEYWLLLHLKMTTRGDLVNGEAAKRIFRSEFGRDYSTNRGITERALGDLLLNLPEAVRNAELVRKGHESAATPSPAHPSTEVDLLVRGLKDSVPPHLREDWL